MKHISIPKDQSCEFINVQGISPMISKCQIKVCYVSDDPNRNRSVITKQTATEMAPSLRGAPIVGKFNETKGDFEEHNTILKLKDNEWVFDTDTRPYGFVDVNANIWFQTFIDDNSVEREYLVTEGYIWTGRYPETQRVLTQGNNQSMELDEKTLQGEWTEMDNSGAQFFIINDGLFSALCILGDDVEPCFEGAQIKVNFSLDSDEEFKNTLFSMRNELNETLEKGGETMEENKITTYAVEIGDALWSLLIEALEDNYPDPESDYGRSLYFIRGIYEEGTQKFAILRDRNTNKLYKLNFVYDENGLVLGDLVEVQETWTEIETIDEGAVAAYELERYQKNDDKTGEKDGDKIEDKTEDEEPAKYSLDDVVEYQDLMTKFTALEEKANSLETENSNLQNQIKELAEFKANIELKEKQDMINSFYMLSDEDKADCVENIATYSLSDIENKLSVICVKKKVNFNADTEADSQTTFTLDAAADKNVAIPQWLQAVENVQNEMN